METFKEYWRMYLWRDAVRRIITINTIVWLVIAGTMLLWGSRTAAPHALAAIFAVPSSLHAFMAHCWTAVTYMFAQYDFLHLLVNMLWLMLFGGLLCQVAGPERMVVVYLLSGVCGAVAFVLCNLILPGAHNMMMGSSCAVIGISGATAVLMPHWRVNLLIIGEVKLVWITVAAIVLFVVIAPSLDVAVAHAGGLAFGLCYGLLRKKGIDITTPFVEAYDRIASMLHPVAKAKPMPNRGSASADEEREFDALLAKVGRSGYESLTPKERQRLFYLSQRVKH